MKEIKLAGKYSDYRMIVDDDIYEEMPKMKCMGMLNHGKLSYANYSTRREGKTFNIKIHRWIGVFYGILESLDDPRQIDHINHNGLDNRKANLRAVTRKENAQNRRKTEGCTSIFKGLVRRNRCNGRKVWMVRIGTGATRKYLGYFTDEKKAALTYDSAARERGYLESSLNFPA
jgi:hypothetical protein